MDLRSLALSGPRVEVEDHKMGGGGLLPIVWCYSDFLKWFY